MTSADLAPVEAVRATKSALTLGASLLGTWTVALLVRIVLPRWLGPDLFGVFNFADNFAATCFIVLGLGIDTYIQKEIPVRPGHASEFFGGVVVVRLALATLLFAAMWGLLQLAHRGPDVQRLVFVFGVGQLFVVLNGNFAALLQASSRVGGLALLNVAAKIAWAVGVGIVLSRGGERQRLLIGLAFAFVVAEVMRTAALMRIVNKQLGLRVMFDFRAVKIAVVASLPFYINAVLCTVYARIDVTMLSLLSSNREVGWYGSAANFAGLALLLSPLVGWVLMPLLSRAAARSSDELFGYLRRALEVVLIAALPAALVIGVGADIWIRRVFGESFAPAVVSLRVLAPMFVFTYLAMIAATALLLLGHAWTVVAISLAGAILNVLGGIVLIPLCARSFGVGGAGLGAAISLLSTEIVVTVAMVCVVGRRAFDGRSIRAITLAVLSCLPVIALDTFLHRLGPARLVVDAFLWLALALACGAIRFDEMAPLVRMILKARRGNAAA